MRLVVFTLVLLIAAPNTAQSVQPDEQVCLTSADKVRRKFPGKWPSYTERMPEHKGHKCWFPADSKSDKKWKSTMAYKHKNTETAIIKSDNKIKAVVDVPVMTKVKPVIIQYQKIQDRYSTPTPQIDTFSARFEAVAVQAVNTDEFQRWAKGLF